MSESPNARVRAYWNEHIHDLAISKHTPGSPGFFEDLDEYHFDKLHHLLRLVPFDGLGGKRVLDLGCGTGVDLVRFARGGARVTGVDIADGALYRSMSRWCAPRASSSRNTAWVNVDIVKSARLCLSECQSRTTDSIPSPRDG